VLVTDSLPSPSPAAYADPRLRWLAVVILMIVAWLAALPFLSSREADNTMAELQTVIDKERAYDRLLDVLKDAETGQRGYVITGDSSFLAPYEEGSAAVPDALRTLEPLADSVEERAILGEVARLARQKLYELATTIRLRRDGGFGPAVAVVAHDNGRVTMDRLRTLIGERLTVLGRQRLVLRDRLNSALAYNTVLAIIAGLAGAPVIGLSLWVTNRSLRERAEAVQHAQHLAEAEAEQARQSLARSQRLSVASQMLQTMDSLTRAEELRDVLPAYLPKLLPDSSGAVYLYRHSRDFLQRVATWGGAEHQP